MLLEASCDVTRGDGILHAQMAQFSVPYFVCGPFVCLYVGLTSYLYVFPIDSNITSLLSNTVIYRYFDCSYN